MYSEGAAPLSRSLAQKMSHPKKVFDPTYISACDISTFYLY